jgi:hypothetical protein
MWSRSIAAADKQQRPVSLLVFATGALEQPNKSVGLVVVAGVEHSSSDDNSLLADRKYGQKVDSGQKLLQFAFWDNFLG